MKPLVLLPCLALALPAVAQSGMTVTGMSRISVRPDRCTLFLQYPLAPGPIPMEFSEGLHRLGLTLNENKIPLTLTPKGEIRYGKATIKELQRLLDSFHISSYLVLDFSPSLQDQVRQSLLPLALQDGLKKAKALGLLVGASRLRLTGLQEKFLSPLATVTQVWVPESNTQRAAEMEVSQAVTLQFAPLDVIIPLKK